MSTKEKLGYGESLKRGVLTHRQHDGLWIEYGKEGAFERVSNALELIKTCAPYRYRRILQDIDRIVVAPLVTGAEAQYAREINAAYRRAIHAGRALRPRTGCVGHRP